MSEYVVLGINRTTDSSVCIVDGSQSIYSIQKERLTRQKHDRGKIGDLKNLYAARIPGLKGPVDLVVECYSSDLEFERLDEYRQEITEVVRFRDVPHIVQISHHLAHVYSSFFLSPFERAAVMVVDFQGSPVSDFTEFWAPPGHVEPDWLEVSSFYFCDRQEITCLSKQLWNGDRARPVGLGGFYNYLSHKIFPGRGMEGKVMGLAAYGNPYELGLPLLEVEAEKVEIPEAWLELFRDQSRFRYFKDGSGSFRECANLAAAGQRCFEEAQLKIAAWLFKETGCTALCLAGGTALNCVANGRLQRESQFGSIFVPPSPHDGGTALGCAVYGVIEILDRCRDFELVDDFLGPEPSITEIQQLSADDRFVIEQPDDLISRMVDLLVRGEVLALFNGRSELGPRALGHRSILADPRNLEIRSWINKYVKGRELFRPLAPVVLEECASTFFYIDRAVPFMQFAVSVRPEYRGVIPAVTHVDGTARLQTVNAREDLFLYNLLKAFQSNTGIGVLLNTSFNGPGEPIVETLSEAITCFDGAELGYLVVPPYMVKKRNAQGVKPVRRDEALREEQAFL